MTLDDLRTLGEARVPWVCFLGVAGVFVYLTMVIATAKMVSIWDDVPVEKDLTNRDLWGLYVIVGLIWPLTWFIRGAYVLGRRLVRLWLRLMLPKAKIPEARVIPNDKTKS